MNIYEGPPAPEVTVIPIPLEVATTKPAGADFGFDLSGAPLTPGGTIDGFTLNAEINSLLQAKRARAAKAYLLRWGGSVRVPRGAEVGARVIGWTQHGLARDTNGAYVGTYERIKDAEGDGPGSEMLVFMDPELKVRP